ncbi:hypothetical protein [Streptomyces bacillaris]|uniref:hypothetical protein n=1 Tax=Streptomyces bacillaris TaxID=68179 RepID=UPI00363F39EA
MTTRKELTASAARYTIATAKTTAKPGGGRGDQGRAWGFYRTPEVRSFANWIGNAMSGATLFAGRVLPGGAIEPAPEGHPAARIVGEIAGGSQGQAELLREYGRHLAVAGEAWTVVRPREGEREGLDWHVVSVLEMTGKGASLEATIDGKPVAIPAAQDTKIPKDAPVAIRVWDPSPMRHEEADSPVLGSLNELEELRLLSAAVRAITLSRLTGRGVIVVPKGTRFPTAPGADGDDDLIDVFMNVAETAIRDPESAAATVPIILEVPADMVGQIQRLTFESDFDELAIKLREENIRRFATAADIPAEFLLGLGDANHWNAWTLTQEAVRLGIEPRLRVVTRAYTRYWLQPLLEGEKQDGEEWIVAADTSLLRVRTNRSQTALEVHERGVISDRALRRETGFDESDAPTAEETAKRRSDEGQQPPGQNRDLPVDETNDQPNSIPAAATPLTSPALTAAADGLIYAALSAAGQKLKRTPACPRSERGRARATDPAQLHTHLTVSASQIEQWSLLDGAWARVPEIATRYGMDSECLTESLDTYCRELIAAGVPHTYDVVPAAISTCLQDAA